MKRTIRSIACLLAAGALVAACGGGGSESSGANASRGPIKIWYSNNPVEIKWAKQMVSGWNASHPKEKVTAQEIPAAKASEDVIQAAITAGTTPCVIFNGAQIATPDYQHMGGLVPLDSFPGSAQYIEARSGAQLASQYKSPDGRYYQVPWKSNPVMVIYNKAVFKKAGLDPNNPPLTTYAQFLSAARQVVKKGGVENAIAPPATSEFYQSFFDFYPLFAAATGGTHLIENGKPMFDSPAGIKVAEFYHTLFQEGLAPKEPYTVDPFAEGKVAMAVVGPWAIATYKTTVPWGVVPVPTPNGTPPSKIWTFTDAKTISVYTSCQNRATAWDLIKYATSKKQDGKLLEMTGQMPLRKNLTSTYASYFAKNPGYRIFAEQTARTIEVPFVPNSIDIWQNFRDAWDASVIFDKEPIKTAFSQAAAKDKELASGW